MPQSLSIQAYSPSTALTTAPANGHQLALPAQRPQHEPPVVHIQPVFVPAHPAAAADSSVTTVHLADLVHYFKRGWKWGVLTAVPLAVAVFAMLGLGPKVYEAEARLLLRIQDQNVFNFNELGHRPITELSAPMLVNNHRAELGARRFLDYLYTQLPENERLAFAGDDKDTRPWHRKLREAIGLATPLKKLTEQERFAENLAKATRIEPLKESHILRIQIRHGDPVIAASVANKYVEDYIRYVSEQELGITKSVSGYLEKKSDEIRQRLQQSEESLAQYRETQSLVEDTASKDIVGEKVRLLNISLAEAEVKLSQTRQNLETIQLVQKSGSDLLDVKLIADNPDVSAVRKQLDMKLAEREPLMTMLGARHPKMVAINREIDTLKGTLQRNIDFVVTMIGNEEKTLQRQVADLTQQLDDTRSQVLAMGGKNIEQNLLKDQVTTDRDLYQKILTRMSQAELTGQFMDNGVLRLADVAVPPDSPVKPSKPLALVAAILMFGIVFVSVPVGWGVFDDHLLPLIKGERPRRAPHEGVASAASSPFATTAPPPQASGPERLPAPADAPPAPEPEPTPLPAPGADRSQPRPPLPAFPPATHAPVLARLPEIPPSLPGPSIISELLSAEPRGAASSINQLTSTLEMQALSRTIAGGVILVTSAEEGEGKSVAAATLASAFCHLGRSVLLMECNPTSPSFQTWFPHAYAKSSWANDLESLRYGRTNLFLLPAHDLPVHETTELLDGYRSWIERARRDIDWVILDCAPMLRNFTDVTPLAPLATDVIFVNDPAKATLAKVRAALTLLQPMMSSSAMRGVVVNRASPASVNA